MRHDKGFTLLEVLVAVLVLAIGLLGLAKLQMFGLHNNHSANLRTQATALAYDIIDRVRANQAAYVDAMGNYMSPPSPSTAKTCAWDGGGNSVVECTASEMAQYDMAVWQQALSASLPSGVGTVCLDSTPNDGEDTNGNRVIDATEYACDGSGNAYVVKIWWVDEFEDDGSPVIKRFTTPFQP